MTSLGRQDILPNPFHSLRVSSSSFYFPKLKPSFFSERPLSVGCHGEPQNPLVNSFVISGRPSLVDEMLCRVLQFSPRSPHFGKTLPCWRVLMVMLSPLAGSYVEHQSFTWSSYRKESTLSVRPHADPFFSA